VRIRGDGDREKSTGRKGREEIGKTKEVKGKEKEKKREEE
jgi:hypothetical protein